MTRYPVMEYFYSVQGEGFYSGSAAFFIRLGGCDVGCVWCDVKDSWDASHFPQLTIERLLEEVAKTNAKIVIITGGEPAMYDLDPLCDALHKQTYQVHIETSGAYNVRGDFDWITFSPKKFKAPLEDVVKRADELKIVIFNSSDFAWAEKYAALVPETCRLYLQPEWDKQAQMQPLIFDYVLKHPQWKISLQTHKFLGVD